MTIVAPTATHHVRFLILGGLVALGSCGGAAPLASGGAAGTTGAAGAGTAGVSAAGSAGSTGAAGAVGDAGTLGSAGHPVGGGSGAGGVAGATCLGSAAGAGGQVPEPVHTPVGVACPVTVGPGLPAQDGGVVSCTNDQDCQGDGAATVFRHCLRHQCGPDLCLMDDDCVAGQRCVCASELGGNMIHTNVCAPTGCRADADCASGLCSPGSHGRCSTLSGSYFCRGAADTCHADADCASCNHQGLLTPGFSCQYVLEVGHWQCAAITLCNG